MDVRIATLPVLSDKNDPTSLILDNLGATEGEMKRYHLSGTLTSYLVYIFMNSEYVQRSSCLIFGLQKWAGVGRRTAWGKAAMSVENL